MRARFFWQEHLVGGNVHAAWQGHGKDAKFIRRSDIQRDHQRIFLLQIIDERWYLWRPLPPFLFDVF
jgi:hypothetical protein